MKHFFSICIMLILCLLATSESYAFNATDYEDPVQYEQGIYCDCVAYVHELPTIEIQKEFVTVKPLELRQNENFGIFFKDGICLSRDNTENLRPSYKVSIFTLTDFKNFATVTSNCLNWYRC